MNSHLFWRSLAAQAICAGVPFVILLALPISDEFFDDFGFLIGPAVWLAAAYVASHFIPAPRGLVMFSALAGLVAGTLVLIAVSHTPGGFVALPVFAASCSGYDEERDRVAAGAAGVSADE